MHRKEEDVDIDGKGLLEISKKLFKLDEDIATSLIPHRLRPILSIHAAKNLAREDTAR